MAHKNQQTEILSAFEKRVLEARKQIVNSQDEHNMEFVAEAKGVTYVNDSKSSTVESMMQSAQGVDAPVILIMGGHDTDNNYMALSELRGKKIKSIIYLGTQDEDKIFKSYKNESMLFVTAINIEEAVKTAYAYGKTGDIVLFSPACSCNALESYKMRGDEFKNVVRTLRG